MAGSEAPEIGIRAIAELHRIEMSVFSLFKELPQFDIKPDNTAYEPTNCDCFPTGTITHSKCRYCNQVWCPTTLKQDWCPNTDCSQGIKGSNFQPWDEHNKWIKCSTCEMWFKTPDILALHTCYIKVNPAIGGDDDGLPGTGIGGKGAGPTIEEPLVHQDQDQVMPIHTEQSPPSNNEPETVTSLNSPLEEQTRIEEEEPEETEADRYWRTHPARVGLKNNNNKVKFVVE